MQPLPASAKATPKAYPQPAPTAGTRRARTLAGHGQRPDRIAMAARNLPGGELGAMARSDPQMPADGPATAIAGMVGPGQLAAPNSRRMSNMYE